MICVLLHKTGARPIAAMPGHLKSPKQGGLKHENEESSAGRLLSVNSAGVPFVSPAWHAILVGGISAWRKHIDCRWLQGYVNVALNGLHIGHALSKGLCDISHMHLIRPNARCWWLQRQGRNAYHCAHLPAEESDS